MIVFRSFPKQGILAVKPMHIFTLQRSADCRRESKWRLQHKSSWS